MPAQPTHKKNALNPEVAAKFARELRCAVLEILSSAIRLAGINRSSNLNALVRGALREAEKYGLCWFRKVQFHPRVLDPKDVGVLWRTANPGTDIPPSDITEIEGMLWKGTSGKDEKDFICHLDDKEDFEKMQVKTEGHSEAFSAILARGTRRNQLAALFKKNFHWQTLPLNGGPNLEYCAAAVYGPPKTVVAIPVAQHWLPPSVGDWEEILERQLHALRGLALHETAALEICAPGLNGPHWPDFAKSLSTGSTP
jgi:hypothetical protein